MTIKTSTTETEFDLVVIGGGINGAGIARDAAGRGLSVLLCEKDDIAQHTSSSSTKLIHGGLRYLEHYDFKLVRHALQEREVLLRMAPHIIWPLRFVLPHHQSLRPRWLIRLGLFLYDHIGGRKLLPGSHGIDLKRHVAGEALKKEYGYGFEYSDCWVQDSRLVVLNLLDAAERGCDVRVRTEVTDLTRCEGYWQVHLRDASSKNPETVTARALVNASGPWVDRTLELDEAHDARYSTRLVKGSHIVVPKMFEHPYTYIFQHTDNRVLFAVPYEGDYTLLGTTDKEIEGDPGDVSIDPDETEYICQAVSEYFKKTVNPKQVVWTYSGVRPLYDDASSNASKVTRDYKLDLDIRMQAPVLSVYGGKITTFRKLADQAVDMLSDYLPVEKSDWTAVTPLPGGDIPNADFDIFFDQKCQQYAWLTPELCKDYCRNYGTRIDTILEHCNQQADLGKDFGSSLFQAEVDYLQRHEWATTADDILWRRTRKGLGFNTQALEKVNVELNEYLQSSSQAELDKTG